MDAGLKEILEAFHEESSQIIQSLEVPLEALEMGGGNSEMIISVAAKIDGIMGCAKTLGIGDNPDLATIFTTIGKLSEGCKMLGYKSSQIKDQAVLKVIGGLLAEAIELLGSAIEDLKNGNLSFDLEAAKRSQQRLVWISEKLKLSEEDQKNIMRLFGIGG